MQACAGFMLGGTCACVLMRGEEFLPSDGQGPVRWFVLGCPREACLLMTGFVFLLVVGVRHPVLGAAGRWVVLGLGYSWRPWREFLLINNIP